MLFKLNIYKLLKGYHINLFFVLTFIIITAFLNTFTILGIMPIIEYIISQNENTFITKYIESYFIKLNIEINIITLGSLYFLIVLIKNFFFFIEKYLTAKLHFKVMYDLVYNQYNSFLSATWDFYASKNFGTISNTIIKETEKASNSVEIGSMFLSSCIKALFYFGLMLFISIQLSISVLFIIIILVLPIYLTGKVVFKLMHTHTKTSNLLQSHLYNSLNALKLIFGFVKKGDELLSLKKIISKLSTTSINFTLIKTFNNLLNEPISIILVLTTVYFGLNYANMPISLLFAFLYSVNRLSTEVQAIVRSRNDLKAIEPSLNQIFELKEKADQNIEKSGSQLIKTFVNSIKLENIKFSYPGSPETLNNVNLEIACGKMISIVGRSGSGKSTIIDLIMGFAKNYKGSVKIDDIEFNHLNLDSFRNIIGYIPQSPFLFNDTIRKNLLWSNPKASSSDIENACKLANAYDFIINLKKGFDTVVGEKGMKLSGGEAQRLCLARALIKNPQILILDEATSSLDSISEKKIIDAIDKLSGKMTIISVAHRLSTIIKSDKIYNIEDGTIIESGSFDELIKNKSKFYETAKEQGLA